MVDYRLSSGFLFLLFWSPFLLHLFFCHNEIGLLGARSRGFATRRVSWPDLFFAGKAAGSDGRIWVAKAIRRESRLSSRFVGDGARSAHCACRGERQGRTWARRWQSDLRSEGDSGDRGLSYNGRRMVRKVGCYLQSGVFFGVLGLAGYIEAEVG